MWEARGVGTYSKTYPGMLGLKSISLPLIILVSETPILLNSKFNSSNRWTWKFSRFRLMDQPIPAAPSPPPQPRANGGICPPCQSRGWGICKFCVTRWPGICQSRCHSELSTRTRFPIEIYYTEDFAGKTSRLAHFSRTGKKLRGCKGMFSILCMHFFIAYQARIT